MSSWGPYTAIVVGEHDGDTLELDILISKRRFSVTAPQDLGFNVQLRRDGVWLARQAVRTFGDNAPELATPAGKAALAYLQSILPLGTKVLLLSEGFDKYGGRVDASVTLPDGRDLAKAMIDSGNAAIWNGVGPKPLPPAPTA